MSECPTWGGTIRKLWSTDTKKLLDHYLRLDDPTRRMRFAHAVSDEFLREYVKTHGRLGDLAFAYVENGEIRAVAELRKLADNWGRNAEAAFSVEEPLQNQGVGTELMTHIIRAARNRGVQHLYMSCMPDNRRMQAIARHHEAQLHFEYGAVVGDIVPYEASYFSVFGEIFDDRIGFMLAVLDLGTSKDKAA